MTKKLPLELMAWLAGLTILALTNPALHHYTLCPLGHAGFTWCPGCGIGRSISSLLHFDWRASLEYHWFGIPALFILLHRIWRLSQKFI